MGTTWGIIIAVIYIAVHVFGALAKESAKRKEKEKKMAEADRRRVTEARLEVPTVEPGGGSDPFFTPAPMRPGSARPDRAPAPVAMRTGRPVDDLAARRKAQLEKMRTGRPVAAPQNLPPPDMFKRSAPTPNIPVPARSDETIAKQEREHQRAKAKVRGQQKQRELSAAAKRQRLAISDAFVEPEPSAIQGRAIQSTSHATAQTAVGAHRTSLSIQARIRNGHALRELFVLKELIDPPVSLR